MGLRGGVSGRFGPMCILALFTSGYNIVGTGDWEYRLGHVVLRHSPPPPALGAAGGGGVIVNTDRRQET